MQNKNWEQVKELLEQVLNLEAVERINVLNAAAVAPEVRAEVESLLAFEEASEHLMNLSAVEFSKDFFADEDNHSLVGQNIGAYKIVREIGYGGMGAVYLAERADGKFEQKVALKLLKREMNTSALRRRFQQEREILASLEHPNIARLLDAGTTSDKIPFIAMEYIEGSPIDEYCDIQKLDLNQRLDLFRKVCTAVNFAHRNLIVHRDLKPSNILVNDDGNPKLLDFGISKILSAEIEQINSATVTKLGAMTPSYASPEQLQSKSVTTATDIYSLGVILYELLSGHRPFETKESDLKEIYKAVLEDEPPPPSAMVETDAKSFTAATEAETRVEAGNFSESVTQIKEFDRTTASNKMRRTLSKTIGLNSGSLRGDLDNIVLKALRKEPERRYSSAENFAEDIHRHQRGLPVTARPNTFSYRAEKFIKRNRATVFAGILIFLAVIVGIAATLWQARVAQAERVKAEKRFGDVRKLANSYLFDVFPEIEDLEGSLKAREKILSIALEYLDSLSNETTGDEELQIELATAYEKIGSVQGAVSMPNLGDIKAGLENYEKARNLREAVFAVNPGDPKNKEMLSSNYEITAQTLMFNVDTAKAIEYYEKAIKLRRELVAADPSSVKLRTRLGVLLCDFGTLATTNVSSDQAAKLLEEAGAIIRDVIRDDPAYYYSLKATPRILRATSHLKINSGDFKGASDDLDQAVVLTNELIKQKSDDYSLTRSAMLNEMGYCEISLEKRDGREIIEKCSKMVNFNLKQLEKEPDEAFALYDLGVIYYYLAQGNRLAGEPNRALEYAEKSLEPLTKLKQTATGVNDYMRIEANVEAEIAESFLLLNNGDEALKHLTKARETMEKVVAADSTVTPAQIELAKIYNLSATVYARKGDRKSAADLTNQAIAIMQKMTAVNAVKVADQNFLTELNVKKAALQN